MAAATEGRGKPLIAVVDAGEAFNREKNPVLCLSALRPLIMCHRCESFRNIGQKCKPQVKPRVLRLLNLRNSLMKRFGNQKEALSEELCQIEAMIGLAERETGAGPLS